MKNKLLLIALMFLFGLQCFSQSTSDKILPGFWGIDFGCSIDKAQQIMKTKGSIYFDAEGSTSETLIYMEGTFAGEDIDVLSLDFYNGKFYKSVVIIKPSSESRIFSLYEKFKEDLKNKYFEPSKVVEQFESPYEKGDGYEVSAIKLDKVTYGSIWYFSDSSITLLISKTANLAISYSETKTKDIVDEIKKSKQSTDL